MAVADRLLVAMGYFDTEPNAGEIATIQRALNKGIDEDEMLVWAAGAASKDDVLKPREWLAGKIGDITNKRSAAAKADKAGEELDTNPLTGRPLGTYDPDAPPDPYEHLIR